MRRRTWTRWQRIPKKLRMAIETRNGTAAVAEPAKRAKYGNHKVTTDAGTFDSKREAAHYIELAMRQAAAEIKDLKLHPEYELHSTSPVGERIRIGKFTADFEYVEVSTGEVFTVDVKSKPTRTTAYMLRKRLFEAEYGRKLTEVY